MTKSAEGTRADVALTRIRSDILSGRLPPGERLKLPDLSERCGVSVSACREALTRLVGQGLVVNEPHVGFSVTPLSTADLVDLTDARIEIETLVLRRSVTEGDLEWEQGVVSAHHALSRIAMVAQNDPLNVRDDWASAHENFHHALLAGCGNVRLRETAGRLRASAELYRRWSTSLGDEPDRDLAAEHQQLCDLALARDVTGCATALGCHIRHTSELLLRAAALPREKVDSPASSF